MNLKTADKLIELRKSNGLSQEALSEKLGVSRQAISKWERGESSPDTDNLLALAQIYGVTLDDIMNPEKEIQPPKVEEQIDEPAEEKQKEKKPAIYGKLGKKLFIFPIPLLLVGVYVLFNLSAHLWSPSWIIFMLIPIYYHLAGACYAKTKKGFLFAFPIPEIVITLYLISGLTLEAWVKGLILLLIIPIYYWGVAFYKK